MLLEVMDVKELRRLNLDYLNTLKSVLSLLRDPTQTELIYRVGREHESPLASVVG